MHRFAALAVALALPLTLTGCQEGAGQANGSVDLRLVGGPGTGQVIPAWEPEPEYFGVVQNTEDGKHYGQVPVGTYRITVQRGELAGTAEFEVTEGETAAVTVTLR